MVEEINIGGNGGAKPEDNKPKDIVLTITLSRETQQLSVQGPGNGQMFDEPMCFWMLHKAQKFIEAMNVRVNQASLVVPKPRIKDIFRRRR